MDYQIQTIHTYCEDTAIMCISTKSVFPEANQNGYFFPTHELAHSDLIFMHKKYLPPKE